MPTGTKTCQQGDDRSATFVSEFVQFLADSKKWWLAPIVIAFALIALLVVISGTGATPFIYSMD